MFLDFTQDPIPACGAERFELSTLDDEAYSYLERNRALQSTPFERLRHMNPLAIDIYSEHGIDLRTEPLEINVCAQHHNGGFVVDKWWQSNIPHTFIIGEMAGTHGVKRPGGTALNAGQVGGLRAAEYICNVYGSSLPAGKLKKGLSDQVCAVHQKLTDLTESSHGQSPQQAIQAVQHSMSAYAGHVRRLDAAASALTEARRLYRQLQDGDMRLTKRVEVVLAIRAEHLALAQVAFLEAVVEYITSGGGSRGSFMILDDDGATIDRDLIDPATGKPYAFVPENEELRQTIAEVELDSVRNGTFKISRVPVRPIPLRDDPFEIAWKCYRGGEIFRK